MSQFVAKKLQEAMNGTPQGASELKAMLYVAIPSMPAGAFEKTRDWLESREADIALDIEDFGDLRELFKLFLHREAKI